MKYHFLAPMADGFITFNRRRVAPARLWRAACRAGRGFWLVGSPAGRPRELSARAAARALASLMWRAGNGYSANVFEPVLVPAERAPARR